VAHQPQVAELQPLDLQQEMTHPGTMHLHPEPVAARIRRGHLRQALPVAESDLQHHRPAVAKERGQVQQGSRLPIHAIARPQLREGPLLGGRHAPLAQHEAAHGAAVLFGLGGGLHGGAG
jgi:hypothetical protein